MSSVISVLGPTGSGKSTITGCLQDLEGWTRISSGDELREHGSAELIARLEAGEPAGSDELLELMAAAIARTDYDQPIVFDGFPRFTHEYEWLLTTLEATGRTLNAVIELQINPQIALERVEKRNRDGDTASAVARKFTWFVADTSQVLDLAGQRGIVSAIDATQTTDEVYNQVLEAIRA